MAPAGAADRRVRLVVRRPARGRAVAVAHRHDLQHERAATSRTDASTVYEALEDAGLVTAAVNITCYRGRTRHLPTLPWVTKPRRYGPKRFFFYSLFESDRTGRAARRAQPRAPARSTRTPPRSGAGSSRATASTSSPTTSPTSTSPRTRTARTAPTDVALERTDAAIGALLDAAGGPDEFLERYAVVLLSDHGQTHGRAGGAAARRRSRDLDGRGRRHGVEPRRARSTSCPGARVDAAELARRLDGVAVRSRRHAAARGGRGGRAARRRGAALPAVDDGWETSGDARSSTIRRAARAGRRSRIRTPASCSSRRRRAGSSPTSAAAITRAAAATARSSPATRSCPLLTIGRRRARPARITEVAPAVLAHFGVALPAYDGGARQCRLTSGRGWSSGSSARAASTTSACSPRWGACRASSSSRRSCATRAYADAALPIGGGQTISQPYMVALHLRASSRCSGGERVLDVGTGSGYQAAVLAELAARGALDRADPGARGARAREPRRGRLRGPRPRARRRRHARPARARAVRRDRRRRRGARGAAGALRAARAARPARRPGRRRRGQWLEVVVRTPEGPAVLRTVPCRFVPLVGAGGSRRTERWGRGQPLSCSSFRCSSTGSARPPVDLLLDPRVARARLRRALRRREQRFLPSQRRPRTRRSPCVGAPAARGRRLLPRALAIAARPPRRRAARPPRRARRQRRGARVRARSPSVTAPTRRATLAATVERPAATLQPRAAAPGRVAPAPSGTGSSSASSAPSARSATHQPRRLRRAAARGPPLPRRGDVLVPRRGHEQLHVEPALDVPRAARPRRRPGDALLPRLARRARRRTSSCSTC